MRGRKWRAMHARRMFPVASNPTRRDSTTVKTFNEKAEHENDLRQESLRDFETWETEQGE